MNNPIQLEPTAKQYQALNYLKDNDTLFLCFGGGAGGGKSWIGCEWIISLCLVYPDLNFFIARKDKSKLKDSTLKTLFKVLAHHGIDRSYVQYNDMKGKITFPNGSEVLLMEVKKQPSDPFFEDLGSYEFTAGFLEECGEIDFAAFDTLKTRVGRHKNKEYGIPPKIFLTCNPKKNWLYTTFYKPWREGTLPKGYQFIQSLYSDNKHTATEYETMLMSITDTVKRQRLMLGLWEYESNPFALYDFEEIENLFSNDWVLNGKKYITVDVARYGKDKTVILYWVGLRVEKIIELEQSSITDTALVIKKLRQDFKVPLSNIMIDSDGVGGGLKDVLNLPKDFHNNGRAIGKENYANLKAQCAFKLAEVLKNIYIVASPEQQERIKSELEVIQEFKSDDEGKVRVIPRKEIISILGYSPDYWSALLIRMYWEVKPRVKAKLLRV